MRFRKPLASILVVAAVSTTALAVVVQLERTPENTGDFSVTSEMGGDGLVHFAVTCKVARPCWIKAYLLVRKGETRIVETHFPAVVREDSIEYSITYHFAISPEYLDDSTLELAERGIGYSVNPADERHPLPGTGGTDNVFPLKKFAPKAPAKGPAAAIAINASEVLENLKKYDAIYESGFSASGTEEGKDRMELRFGSFLGVKRRWKLTCGDDRFGYTAEVIDHEKLNYQQLVERQRTNRRSVGETSDQDEDSVEPLLKTIRTRTWGYWGQDLSGHYYEDTGFEVTPEDKAMERGKNLHTAVHGPTDTSITASKYVFLYALGRFFSKDLDKVTRVETTKDGLLLVSALGTCGKSNLAPYSSGRWELEIDPAADWMVRKARFYSTAEPQSNWTGIWTEMTNSGTIWSGPYCIPKEATINCYGPINGVETKRLTFDPVAGRFDDKLYSTVRQAVGYNKEPSVEVHDYRVSPDTITEPNRPKPEPAQH